MKRLSILFVLFPYLLFAQIGWNNLASNQMVSFTDAQSSPFYLKAGQSHVSSSQLMTKADILAKYNVSISGYFDNQLVPKGAWVQGAIFQSDPYFESATKNDCVGYANGSTVTLTAYAGQFTSPASVQDANNQAVAWVRTNKQAYANANGTCTLFYEITSDYNSSNVSSSDACAGTLYRQYIYTTNSNGIVNIGDTVYTSDGDFFPYYGVTQIWISFYQAGNKVWIKLDASGTVIDKGTCAVYPAVTLYGVDYARKAHFYLLDENNNPYNAATNIAIVFDWSDGTNSGRSSAIIAVGTSGVFTPNLSGIPINEVSIVSVNPTNDGVRNIQIR